MVSINSGLYSFIVYIRVLECSRHEHIRGYVVGSPDEHRNAIQLQIERTSQAIGVRRLYPVDRANAKPKNLLIQVLHV